MGVVVINGFDGVDDNISSGSLGSGDTPVSYTHLTLPTICSG